MEHYVQILATIVLGTLVGVEFGVAAFTNPIFKRLPDDARWQARAAGGRILGTVMPFWYIGATALMIAVAVLTGAPTVISAVVVMGVVMVLTLTTLVPINNAMVAAVGAGSVATAEREQADRWDRLHWLRVALVFVALVLLALS